MAAAERGKLLRLVAGQERRSEQPDALADVARAAVAGDRAAIRTLLMTVGPQLLRVVRRVLGARHPDVEDVAQESAFAIMDALPRHRGESTILHFVCRIAALTAMNARRRDARQKRTHLRDDERPVEVLPSAAPGPEAELSSQDSAELVLGILDALPHEQAEVLTLHCVLGYTVPEIAAVAHAPLETIRSRLRLAKQAVREKVRADPELSQIVEETS